MKISMKHVPFVSLNKSVTGKKDSSCHQTHELACNSGFLGAKVEDCRVQGFQIVE